MFLSNASVRRPVAVSALVIAMVLLGFNAYRKLGVENMPSIDVPYITITTVAPGFTPREIETDIAKKIEDVVSSVDGLKHITSSCMENVCQTFLEFHLDVDVDIAATDVREQLGLIKEELPAEAEDPQVVKFDINAQPVINLGLTGDLSLDELYDYADNTLSDRISIISGVARIEIIGGAEREVHVLLNRDVLAARGLTTADVVQALRDGIKKVPSGTIQEGGTEFSVIFDAEMDAIDEIGGVEVATERGIRCYLRDLAKIRMDTEERRQAAFIDRQPGIAIRIIKRADANAVQLVRNVRSVFDELSRNLPGGMRLRWISDIGVFIESSVDAGLDTIVYGVLLTACVLFLFLYNVRSTFVVAMTMPATVIISFYFLQLLDYTLNMSTLLALALSVGILVTNSIVVLESIVRHISEGRTVKDAARSGTGRTAVAVLASASTNIVVLFPIAMMKSRIGLFFAPFALTMLTATAVSLFISFTLTPILSSQLLKPVDTRASKSILQKLESLWNRMFDVISTGYERLLRFLEKRRLAALGVVVLAVFLLIHAVSLVPRIGFSFVPDFDQGEVFVKMEFPTRYSLENTTKRVTEIEHLLDEQLPHVEHLFTTIGKVQGIIGQSSEGVYLAQTLIKFSEKTARTETIHELLTRCRTLLKGVPDAIIIVNISSTIGGQEAPVQLEIAGESIERLDSYALRIADAMEEIEGLSDIDTTVRSGKPEIRIFPDRSVLSDLHIPPVGFGMTLRGNLEGIEAASYKKGDRTYDIRVKHEDRDGAAQVNAYLFPGAPGKPVSLESFADIHESRSPVQITRKDKRRISKVFANIVGGMPLGTAVGLITERIDEAVSFPSGYDYTFTGQYEVMQEGNDAFVEAALLSVLLTYLLIAAIMESFVMPLIILTTVPLGLIGMLWGLYGSGESLSVFAILGGVMLIGIVVNNAILIMSDLIHRQEAGEATHSAMIHAAKDQLRPIIMITFAAILGMLPLALGRDIGSEVRIGIGWASIGGIAVSALLSLVIVPVLYDLLTRKNKRKH